jgi:hypothetical protein
MLVPQRPRFVPLEPPPFLASATGWILHILENVGVPYGSRTRVAAVKEKRPIVIQGNLAAWIALYRI